MRGGVPDVLGVEVARLLEGVSEPSAAAIGCRSESLACKGGSTGYGLQASGLAAPTDDVLVIDDGDVADVAGAALGPTVDAPLRDEASPDPRADLDVDDVLAVLG
jgi:hypothetical protein